MGGGNAVISAPMWPTESKFQNTPPKAKLIFTFIFISHSPPKKKEIKKEIRVTYMGRLLTKFSWTDKKQLVIMIVYMCSCSKISALLVLSFSVTWFILCIILCHFLLLLREPR
jgi:hypothetical protein